MIYKNKGGQSREKTMLAAYSLVKDFGAKQDDVAKVLRCSQPTVANWVKEIGFQAQINDLSDQLKEAKSYIHELNNELGNNYLTFNDNEDDYIEYIEHNENDDDESDDDESEGEYVPDYGYEDADDNWEHALDDIYKANNM